MPPEQKEKSREEIVQNTGWGFLVRGTTFPAPLITQEKPPQLPSDSSKVNAPASPTEPTK
jgi:hypothetical protein